MRGMRRTVSVLAAALAVGVASMGVAQATPPDTSACKNGGYASYIDPLTGTSFANQGRCVSTLARGGALVPVAPPVRTSLYISNTSYNTYFLDAWFYGPDGTYPVTVLVDGVTTWVGDVDIAGGSVLRQWRVDQGTHTYSVVVEDQTFTSQLTTPVPPAVVPARVDGYVTDPAAPGDAGCSNTHLILAGTPGAVARLDVKIPITNGMAGNNFTVMRLFSQDGKLDLALGGMPNGGQFEVDVFQADVPGGRYDVLYPTFNC